MKTSSFEIPFDEFKEKFKDELQNKVVVVSVFGKSSLLNFAYKQSVVSDLFSYHFNFPKDYLKLDKESLCSIECQYNDTEKVIYMNLRGSFDTATLLHVFKKFSSELKTEGFLAVWSKLKNHYARALMFLFSVSHIIVMVHPSHCLDLNCINLLKAVSYIRPKYQASVSSLLKTLPGANKEWAQQGRLNSPRLLFVFTNCPESILQEKDEERLKRIKKLERTLEDHIYSTLRKVHLVKNICDHACFSIAPNDQFVYVCCDDSRMNDYYGSLLASVIRDCNSDDSSEDEPCGGFDETEEGFGPNPFALLGFSTEDEREGGGRREDTREGEGRRSLDELVACHVRTAHGKGFYDNMGKYALNRSYLELPTLEEWFVGANAVAREGEASSASCLERILSKELRFSSARCGKVYPLAVLAYKENLPQHYGAKVHKQKLALAVAVFLRQARGPEAHRFVERLEAECDRFWKAGRQSEEAARKNGETAGEEKWSARYASLCDCCLRLSKADALSARVAQIDLAPKDCLCSRLEKEVLKPRPRKLKASERRTLEVV